MAFLSDQLGTLAVAIIAAVIVRAVGIVIYNVFFHPLRAFPGPRSYAMSRLPYCYRLLRGTLPFDMLALHEKYGDIVRIAPNELAFSTADAWKDIMGHQAAGTEEVGKWAQFYRAIDYVPTSIINAPREEHSVLRRQMSHGFSEKSMRAQEPLIRQYVDLLIQRLRETSAGSNPLDMVAWYNFTTFDIIGDLAFGKGFDCLKNSCYHPFIPLLLKSAQTGTVLLGLGSLFPRLKSFLISSIPKSMLRKFEEQRELSFAKLRERMQAGKGREDLIEGLLRKQDELGLTLDKLEANSTILLIGGSETTATLLSGVTFLLVTNPKALARLADEVRSSFASEDEIDINSVGRLTYMMACLNETLRMYPPVPAGLPRLVPKSGRRIVGHVIPENTVVAVHHWATYHNKKHFADPFEFHPERFLGDERYSDDNFDILQPFHVGPRNCLGRNLAYAEMRLILARVIYNFDMKIASDSLDWMQTQKVYFLWEKPPLHVHLTPVR
ncbi:cytochrome P450 [Aspergillus taichungensis]|uniref:Cytochrome P450 n=1 Tax=Aspergillus taichungensis TaxID=482145 RepID=A0A2J5I437_9EURO|nr:cytochrome P450 [Aspergillus taichungensis]